jgi:hypothetical protein
MIEVPEEVSDARKAFDYLQAKFISDWQRWRKGVEAKWEEENKKKETPNLAISNNIRPFNSASKTRKKIFTPARKPGNRSNGHKIRVIRGPINPSKPIVFKSGTPERIKGGIPGTSPLVATKGEGGGGGIDVIFFLIYKFLTNGGGRTVGTATTANTIATISTNLAGQFYTLGHGTLVTSSMININGLGVDIDITHGQFATLAQYYTAEEIIALTESGVSIDSMIDSALLGLPNTIPFPNNPGIDIPNHTGNNGTTVNIPTTTAGDVPVADFPTHTGTIPVVIGVPDTGVAGVGVTGVISTITEEEIHELAKQYEAKIETIKRDHLTEKDVEGANKDCEGNPILRPDGTPWNHFQEVKEAIGGIVNVIYRIQVAMTKGYSEGLDVTPLQKLLSKTSEFLDSLKEDMPSCY